MLMRKEGCAGAVASAKFRVGTNKLKVQRDFTEVNADATLYITTVGEAVLATQKP